MLFIGLAPLLVISAVSLTTVIETRLENISELESQVIDSAAEKIKRYLDQKMSVFNLVVDLEIENISEVEKEKIDFLAKGLKEATGNVEELVFIDRDGRELAKETNTLQTEPLSLQGVSERDDFETAIAGKNYFGPVEYNLAEPTMIIASQIENKNRQIIGVISAEINLKPVEEEISQIRLGEKGFVYLVDEQGKLITSSNKNFASQGEDLTRLSLVKDVVSGKTHNGLSEEDRYKNPLADTVIFSGKTVEKVGWAVMVEWPWQDAFSVVWTMLTRFLLILFVSLILVAGFSVFFGHLVVKPVEILSKGADEISKGNFDYKISIKTKDELEKLGERFNKMISVLKENQRLRDEFVFVAAHELRAPVTVIKGYLSMVLEGDYGKISKETKSVLETASNLNERLVKLVFDLLEVARSEAGKMEIEVKPTSVKESVQEVLKEFENMAIQKGIQLVYKGLAQDAKAMADGYRVKEVLTNLIGNAIKYTLGKGTVEISHEVKDNYLITNVRDEGMGISEENVKKLFSKFFRVKTEETREIEGTGLGLFICKEIIERMAGKIWATSQLDKGSTFSFSLRLA